MHFTESLQSHFLPVTSVGTTAKPLDKTSIKGTWQIDNCATLQGEQIQVIVLSRQNECFQYFSIYFLSPKYNSHLYQSLSGIFWQDILCEKIMKYFAASRLSAAYANFDGVLCWKTT